MAPLGYVTEGSMVDEAGCEKDMAGAAVVVAAVGAGRGGGFLVQIGNEHGSGFHVEDAVAAGFDLLQS